VAELDPEGRHWLGDVLDLLGSGELVADDQLATDLVVHGARDDDAAGSASPCSSSRSLKELKDFEVKELLALKSIIL